MKKGIRIFGGAIILASVFLVSCSGEEKKEVSEVKIKPKTTKIKGDLGDYFEVVSKDYVVKVEKDAIMGQAIISVEVKRTDKDFTFPTDKINPFGTNGGEDYHVGFGIEFLGDSGPLSVKQATEGGMGGPYSSEDVTNLMKLKKGETGFIRWTVDKLDGLKSFELTSALQKEEHSSTSASGESEGDSDSGSGSGDCDQFCSDYESFADDYVAFMQKYKKNQSDPTILAEYSEMMQKASEMQKSAGDCNGDPAVAARLSKVAAKMASALR